ncbi:MAG: hypothetical protein ACE5JM_08120 [Armatimonadota bacterium]
MRASAWCALALAAAAATPALPADEESVPIYTARLVQLPRAARQNIFQSGDVLKKRATRIFSDDRPLLDVWLPSRVPPPNGLFDGILLVILAPPQRPRPESMVTVRTMEKGMRIDFSTIQREDAQRTILKLRRSLKTWRRFDETRPLALVGPEEPVWLDLPPKGPRAILQADAGELYLTLALQPDQKRGVRWQLPPRIRKLLGL